MARLIPVQLGARLVRRGCRRTPEPHGPPHRRGGRGRDATELRADGGAFRARGELVAGAGGGPGRPYPRHAAESGRTVGGDARRHETRRRAHPVHDAAHRVRRCRPRRARAGVLRHCRREGRSDIRHGSRRLHEDRRRRGAGMALLRRRSGGRTRVQRRWRNARRRHTLPLFHLRHYLEAEVGRAYIHVIPGRTSLDDVLARPATGRRSLQYLVARVGQARVELLLRAVERRGDRLRLQLQPLRRRRVARGVAPRRGHDVYAPRRPCGDCSFRPILAMCRQLSGKLPGPASR